MHRPPAAGLPLSPIPAWTTRPRAPPIPAGTTRPCARAPESRRDHAPPCTRLRVPPVRVARSRDLRDRP